MSKAPWTSLRKAADLATEISDEKVAEKVDRYLNAAMETVTEKLAVAPVDVLSEGSRLAKGALDAVSRAHEIDRLSPSYIAGRLAAASDVLGFAARQTAEESLLPLAKMQPYATILGALYDKPMRNTDLVEALNKNKSVVSRALTTLREHEAVVSHKDGRELYNALTPVARLIVEAGVQDARRAPLAASRVHCLDAEFPPRKFNLHERPAPADMTAGNLPMLSVANG